MQKEYKRMSHEEFINYIDKLSNNLEKYIKENNLKIDFICPVLRSGAIPAVYISNKLNIVKFLPMQVKHVKYNNGESKIEMLLNSLGSISIKKNEPVFLIIEALHSSGESAKICIDAIKNKYSKAKILYICLAKAFNSRNFRDITIYEDNAIYYNKNGEYTKDECLKLNIEYYSPLFPWEKLENELNHPDDLEENIFF